MITMLFLFFMMFFDMSISCRPLLCLLMRTFLITIMLHLISLTTVIFRNDDVEI